LHPCLRNTQFIGINEFYEIGSYDLISWLFILKMAIFWLKMAIFLLKMAKKGKKKTSFG